MCIYVPPQARLALGERTSSKLQEAMQDPASPGRRRRLASGLQRTGSRTLLRSASAGFVSATGLPPDGSPRRTLLRTAIAASERDRHAVDVAIARGME